MKNVLMFVLLVIQITVTNAQGYVISWQTTSGGYEYSVLPDFQTYPMMPDFTEGDLITWIFPDGQNAQHLIHLNNGVLIPGSNDVEWQPYNINAPTGPDDIRVYVAKKGGTGNPSIVGKNTSFSGQQTAFAPAPIYFPPGKNWQVNRSWEFSPGDGTFLIVSYKNDSTGCTPAPLRFIELHYDYGQFNIEEIFGFNSESITTPSSGVVRIANLNTQYGFKNVYIKLKPTLQLQVRDSIKITALGKFCAATTDSIVLQYSAKGGPHDPNRKTVDINTICAGQSDPIKLTYTIQFHNDGTAPVKLVKVTDQLPPELQSATFDLLETPNLNGLTYAGLTTIGTEQNITFTELNNGQGLPGFGQKNPSYSYDQTIYRFSFTVNTIADFNTIIENQAEVEFFDNNISVGTLLTNIDTVIAVDPGPGIDCYVVSTSEISDAIGELAVKPNPFQDQTDITFELKEKSKLQVEVRDVCGRLVTTIATGEFTAGAQQHTWDGSSYPEGVYLVFIRTEKGSIAKKMVKMR